MKGKEEIKGKKAEYKFTLWGIKPNEPRKGSLLLIFLGVYNSLSYIFTQRLDSIIVGLIFVLFGVAAYKKLRAFLYIGAFLWLIGILGSLIETFSGQIKGNYAVLFLQLLFLWSLIKATPLYNKQYSKGVNKDNISS